ncbi:hypothetical protein G6F65_016013 [Rhizopus arrhizus]|nr:hypothetical protein G6F65_016013 [Rhizopus arrhizus]
MAPVAQGRQVAQVQAFLQAQDDARQAAGDLAGDERLAALGRFVVEQDAVAGVHPIGFAVVHADPIGVQLGGGVGAARIEGGGFLLRRFLHQAIQLRGGGLVEARLFLQLQDADGFQQAQSAQAVGVGGVFRLFERHPDVALRRQVVDLVRLNGLHDADQAARIGHVAVMQHEIARLVVRILVQVVDARGVEQRSAPLDAVDLIALGQQELRQVGPVLAGNAVTARKEPKAAEPMCNEITVAPAAEISAKRSKSSACRRDRQHGHKGWAPVDRQVDQRGQEGVSHKVQTLVAEGIRHVRRQPGQVAHRHQHGEEQPRHRQADPRHAAPPEGFFHRVFRHGRRGPGNARCRLHPSTRLIAPR